MKSTTRGTLAAVVTAMAAATGAAATTPAVAADHDATLTVPLHQGHNAVQFQTDDANLVLPVTGHSMGEATRHAAGTLTPGAVEDVTEGLQVPLPKTKGAMVQSEPVKVRKDQVKVSMPGGGLPDVF